MKLKPFQKTILLILGAILFFNFLLLVLPYKDLKAFKNRPYSTRFFDCNGVLLFRVPLENGLVREYSSAKEIPSEVKKAFIKAEDKRFYFHCGIDLISISRAVFQNIKSRRNISGASTITMQLARIISPSQSRSIRSKLKDAVNALRLEAKLSKKQILELYLNNIPFGRNVEGITSAAWYFYEKSLSELNQEEIFCLSVIPRNPDLYNPGKNPEKVSQSAFRTFKNRTDYDSILAAARNSGSYTVENLVPHYSYYLKKYHPEIFNSEKNVYLSLNVELQFFCQKILKDTLSKATDSRIQNGAVFVTEVQTGKILAWVGSEGFYDDENSGQIDGILNPMQPGSSMKPFLYGLAFDKNIIKPAQVLPDVPVEYGTTNIYVPFNFNNRFNGPVKTRVALASSLNIPAVEILNETGIDEYLNLLHKAGFKSLAAKGSEYGLNLALGGGEVRLYELVPAFASFARDGIFLPPSVLRDENRKTAKAAKDDAVQLYSMDTARLICQFLSDKKPRALGFGYTQSFQTEYPSIFKTGTSNQFQNITALGATKKYAAGVWMGNFNGHTVIGKTGSSLPASVAKEILDLLEDGTQPEDFEEPLSYHLEKICTVSGKKPTQYCKESVYEYVKNSETLEECDWHRLSGDGTRILTVYPAEYQQWFYLYRNQKNQSPDSFIDYSTMDLTIKKPRNNSIFYYDYSNQHVNQIIPVEIFGGKEDKVEVTLDDKAAEVYERPFSFSIPVPEKAGYHKLTAVCGSQKATVEFEIK